MFNLEYSWAFSWCTTFAASDFSAVGLSAIVLALAFGALVSCIWMVSILKLLHPVTNFPVPVLSLNWLSQNVQNII
jgi:hypothetical protein